MEWKMLSETVNIGVRKFYHSRTSMFILYSNYCGSRKTRYNVKRRVGSFRSNATQFALGKQANKQTKISFKIRLDAKWL